MSNNQKTKAGFSYRASGKKSGVSGMSVIGIPTFNFPTILTILRIVFVFPLVILMFQDDIAAKLAAILCFVVASATDFADGRLARATGQVTDLGAFLDPLADKMLINLTFLVLVYQNIVPLWMFAVILVRDFAVDGIRMLAARKGTTISASIFGKAKTMTQMFTILLIMFNKIYMNDVLTVVCTILLYVVIALTVFSGAYYIVKGRNLLSK